jgi:anti-anti-sigma factor
MKIGASISHATIFRNSQMNISEEKLDGSIYKITLSGRMDAEGTGYIETRFAGMTAAPRMSVIVDLSAVSYMASLGIRAVIMNAKAVVRRGGKFALLSPQENVRQVLNTTGIDTIIPFCDDLDQAIAKVVSQS